MTVIGQTASQLLAEQNWTGKIFSDGWVDAPETIEPAPGDALVGESHTVPVLTAHPLKLIRRSRTRFTSFELSTAEKPRESDSESESGSGGPSTEPDSAQPNQIHEFRIVSRLPRNSRTRFTSFGSSVTHEQRNEAKSAPRQGWKYGRQDARPGNGHPVWVSQVITSSVASASDSAPVLR